MWSGLSLDELYHSRLYSRPASVEEGVGGCRQAHFLRQADGGCLSVCGSFGDPRRMRGT